MQTHKIIFLAGVLLLSIHLVASDETSLKLIGFIDCNYRYADQEYGIPGQISEPDGVKVQTVEQANVYFQKIRERFAQDNDFDIQNDQSQIIRLCPIRLCLFLRNSGYASNVYWAYIDQSDQQISPMKSKISPMKSTIRSISYPYYYRK